MAVFRMEERYTLKLEWNRLEQVFKLDARDGVENLDDVLVIIDKSFIENAREVFKIIMDNKNRRIQELQEITGEEFPEII